MNAVAELRTARSPYRGLTQVVAFNWPKYIIAAALLLVLLGIGIFGNVSFATMGLLVLAGTPLFVWSLGSVLASHWVYDRSPIRDWHLLPQVLGVPSADVCNWINVHSGFDDTTIHLEALFPIAEGQVVSLYDAAEMTERSIHRAKAWSRATREPIKAKSDALPLADESVDVVFLLLAIHELRRPELREAFFREVRRVLRAHGKVILVEHLRDGWNFLAFGPGAFHFYSRGEWLRVARLAHLKVADEGRITPFVHWFLFEKERENGSCIEPANCR